MSNILRAILAAAGFAVLLWALIAVPTWFDHAEGVKSAAETAGYNNRIAHVVAVIWLAGMISLAYGTASRVQPTPPPPVQQREFNARDLILPLLVTAVVAFLYFPPALAWNGPFFEESIHVTTLHRMAGGDLPYRDFEFLYGPLMLFIPWLWVNLTSFTLTSYYSYILLLELLTLLLLLAVVQRHIRDFWPRVGAYALLAALYFNAMLGPNQNGLRKLLGVVILLSVAANPLRPAWWVGHGAALGLLMGYSQEFGAATAIGIAAIYAALFFKTRDKTAITGLATIAATSIVVWIGSIWLVLGQDISAYFSGVRYLTGQFDSGEAAFAYYWTVNGLAVFLLIGLSAWVAGQALAQDWDQRPAQADLFVIGGLGYAAIALKSGLSRADQWHLDPTVLVLCFAFVLPLAGRYVVLDKRTRAFGIFLVFVLAATFSLGQMRIARFTLYEQMLGGMAAWASQDRQPCEFGDATPVLPALACQNGDPDTDDVALARRFAETDFRDRPIFTYSSQSTLPARIGARRAGYLTDEFIYGDQRAQETQEYLAARPEILISVTKDTLDWLRMGPEEPVPQTYFALSGSPKMRRLLGAVSSVHHAGLQDERDVQVHRWRQFIGNWMLDTYQPVFEAGNIVIMEQRE